MQTKFFLSFLFTVCTTLLLAQNNKAITTFNNTVISAVQLKQASVDNIIPAKISLTNKPLQLFIFLSPECPLSKNYTLPLNKLFQQYNQQVEFFGCISGKGFTDDEIKSFIKTYKINFPVLVDESKKLTSYIAATVTPEVILLNNKGALIYKGAIDDWVQDIGKQKPAASKYYLQDAIVSTLNSKPVIVKETKAYGCLINDY